MDDSLITPLNKGVDHFNYTEGACPGPAPEGEVLVPETQSRYEDEDQDDAEVTRQIGLYSGYMKTLEDWSQSHDTNFYASHRPLFAVACDGDHMNVLDWTMQQSLGPHTLDRVSAAIAGHMHWFEALSFENQGLPAQIVVGNAGTDLIKNYVNQETLPTIELRVGVDDAYTARVEAGITARRGQASTAAKS
uniref:Calcineurin-like phosphoesterase domain-containing protein n=2 Tax=Chrysotila carterae TaxID=13221 RepID=A0A7S4B6Q2_CHRCT